MENLSEVLKILEGALKANGSMAANYAGLLADKLERNGERQQAMLVREILSRSPKALAFAQDASNGVSLAQIPVDGESRLETVDISMPTESESELLLPSGVSSRINDFLKNVNHHDELARAGAELPARLLVYGPPGTGKTRLARYIASRLKLPLLTVRCDTLVSSMLGQTSRNLRRVFDFTQRQAAVLFLDEFDALASARGNDRDVGELQRVVIALLQNIDALPDNTILLAATNHEQLLDPAIWRRFAFRVVMPVPDEAMRRQLWNKKLDGFSVPKIDIDELAEFSEGVTGAVIEQVSIDARRDAVLDGRSFIDENELFRRLGLAIAMGRKANLSQVEDEIFWLRAWAPKRFSLRVLAGLYGKTVRQITSVTNGVGRDGKPEKRQEIKLAASKRKR